MDRVVYSLWYDEKTTLHDVSVIMQDVVPVQRKLDLIGWF